MPIEDMGNGRRVKYRNCPVRFIPESIVMFHRIKKFYAQFPSSPFQAMKDTSLRFIMANNIYESKMIEFKEKE